MLQKFVSVFGGDPNKRTVEKLAGIVDEINSLEPEFEQLSDEALRAKTEEFRSKLTPTLPPPFSEKMGEGGGGGARHPRRNPPRSVRGGA